MPREENIPADLREFAARIPDEESILARLRERTNEVRFLRRLLRLSRDAAKACTGTEAAHAG